MAAGSYQYLTLQQSLHQINTRIKRFYYQGKQSFRFLDADNGQGDESNKVDCVETNANVELAKPKEPPDALHGSVVSNDLSMALEVGEMRDTSQQNM
ncbi:putative MAP7 domain-containing protein 3 [Sesbania bispinosa]|nr:putative MAP7 domain-containing protein 3 [Sesbania bispinosa]